MICAVADCTGDVLARGWCSKHYDRWRRHGDPLTVLPPNCGRQGRPRVERPPCRVSGCENRSVKSCRGWCQKHYVRWYRHGDPSIVLEPTRVLKDVMETLHGRTIDEDGCLTWQGAKTLTGYGVFGIKGHSRYVHRAAWEYVNGPVPSGLQLHHICLNRACCNPEHLVPLTARDHSAAHRRLVAA
jgi:hypothetical protein